MEVSSLQFWKCIQIQDLLQIKLVMQKQRTFQGAVCKNRPRIEFTLQTAAKWSCHQLVNSVSCAASGLIDSVYTLGAQSTGAMSVLFITRVQKLQITRRQTLSVISSHSVIILCHF